MTGKPIRFLAVTATAVIVCVGAGRAQAGQARPKRIHKDAERGFTLTLPGKEWRAAATPDETGAANVVLRRRVRDQQYLAIFVTVGFVDPSDPLGRKAAAKPDKGRAATKQPTKNKPKKPAGPDISSILDGLESSFRQGMRNPRRRARRKVPFNPSGGRVSELVLTGLADDDARLFRRYLVFVTRQRLWIVETVAAGNAHKTYAAEIASAIASLKIIEPKLKLSHTDSDGGFSLGRPGLRWDFVLQGPALGASNLGLVRRTPRIFAGAYVSVTAAAEKPDIAQLVEDFRERSRGLLSSVKKDAEKDVLFPPTGDKAVEVTIVGSNNQRVELVRRAYIFISKTNGNAYTVETVASRADVAPNARAFAEIIGSFKALPRRDKKKPNR